MKKRQYILEKPRSRTQYELVCCDNENWFYDIIEREKSTKKIKHRAMITLKDVPVRLESLLEKGYTIISDTNI
jgi:hypothetical protein